MGIKSYSPYTPSRRHMTGSDFSEITKSTPEKSLVVSLKKNAGRNNQGKITVRHRGGGSRRKYRIIDFKSDVCCTVRIVLDTKYGCCDTVFCISLEVDDSIFSSGTAASVTNGDFTLVVTTCVLL